MVHLIPYDKIEDTYEGKKVLKEDACKKKTVAVIFNGATMIPVCEDCLDNMKSVIDKIS